jgi:hypothetical protein
LLKPDELPAEQIKINARVHQPEQMPGNRAAPSSRIVIERVIRHFTEVSEQDANFVDDGRNAPSRFFIARQPGD